MKLTLDQISELIAAELNTEPDQVRPEIEGLLAAIRHAGSTPVKIETLGEFTRSEADEPLKFKPRETFLTELNFPYAGLQPVVLAEGESAGLPLADPDDFAGDEDFDQEELISVIGDKEKKKDEEVKEDTEDEKPPVVLTPASDDKAEKAEDQPEPEPAEEPVAEDKKSEEETIVTGLGTATPDKPEQEAKPEPKPDPKPKTPVKSGPQRPKDRTPLIAAVALLVIALVITLAIVLTSGDEQQPAPDIADTEVPSETLPEPEPESPTEIPDPEPESVPDSPEDTPDVEIIIDPPEGDDRPTAPDTPGEWGLYGNYDPDLGAGYTINLHSLNSQQAAEAQTGELSSMGFRTIVYPVTLDDGRRSWRMSVGQFETLNEARRAAGELPRPYLTNNFISRFDPDSL